MFNHYHKIKLLYDATRKRMNQIESKDGKQNSFATWLDFREAEIATAGIRKSLLATFHNTTTERFLFACWRIVKFHQCVDAERKNTRQKLYNENVTV